MKIAEPNREDSIVTLRNRRAALYLRIRNNLHTPAQNDFELAKQQSELTSYCARKGIEIFGVFKDVGYGGYDLDRPGLQAMLRSASKKQFDVVLAVGFDRLFHNQLLLLQCAMKLEKKAIEILQLNGSGKAISVFEQGPVPKISLYLDMGPRRKPRP